MLSARTGASLKIVWLTSIMQTLAIGSWMWILAVISILATVWFKENLQTGLSVVVIGLGLDLVVVAAVLADRGCWARSTWRSTWSSRAWALAKTTNLRHASWRFAVVTSSRSPLPERIGKIAAHSVTNMLSVDWKGFDSDKNDRGRSSIQTSLEKLSWWSTWLS